MPEPTSSVPNIIVRYGLSVVVVALVVPLKLLLAHHIGREGSFLLFFGAVMVAAAYGGFGPGLLATFLSAASGVFFFIEPRFQLKLGFPNQKIGLAIFVSEGIFISLLSAMLKSARRRAEESARTARSLERQILEVSEREQRRIGHDLHDGLGQHLTGIAFMSRLLSQRLSARNAAGAEEARRIEQDVNKAVSWTRDLAAGLAPVEADAEGLPDALRDLAISTEEIFKARCVFKSEEAAPRALPADRSATTHLFRIAQEAVSNAIRHGQAKHIWIELDRGRLSIRDDGSGLPPAAQRREGGMGLKTMKYRATIIGGLLDVRPGETGGTVVTCTWPNAAQTTAAAAGGSSGSTTAAAAGGAAHTQDVHYAN